MITHAELTSLVDKIKSATESGRLKWKVTEGGYAASFPRSSVKIDRNEQKAYSFSVLNENNESVESFSSRAADSDIGRLLHNLFALVQRQALLVDATINDIMAYLEGGSNQDTEIM